MARCTQPEGSHSGGLRCKSSLTDVMQRHAVRQLFGFQCTDSMPQLKTSHFSLHGAHAHEAVDHTRLCLSSRTYSTGSCRYSRRITGTEVGGMAPNSVTMSVT